MLTLTFDLIHDPDGRWRAVSVADPRCRTAAPTHRAVRSAAADAARLYHRRLDVALRFRLVERATLPCASPDPAAVPS